MKIQHSHPQIRKQTFTRHQLCWYQTVINKNVCCLNPPVYNILLHTAAQMKAVFLPPSPTFTSTINDRNAQRFLCSIFISFLFLLSSPYWSSSTFSISTIIPMQLTSNYLPTVVFFFQELVLDFEFQ